MKVITKSTPYLVFDACLVVVMMVLTAQLFAQTLPPTEQPAVIDAYDKSDDRWGMYGRSAGTDRSNHSRLNGENVVFIDGHGEWRTSAQVQPRYALYDGWVYW